jgi:hypothetical protein
MGKTCNYTAFEDYHTLQEEFKDKKTIRVLVFVPLSFTQTPITMRIKPTWEHEGM